MIKVKVDRQGRSESIGTTTASVQAPKLSLLRAQRHSEVLAAIRQFFTSNGYQEVTTPLISPSLLPEPAIEIFSTQLHQPEEESPRDGGMTLFLSPSPERHMRRLISAGSGPIFQIAPAFRNGAEIDDTHSPEFTLLEWYSPACNYMREIGRLEQLVTSLPAAAPFPTPFKRIRIRKLLLEIAGINIDLVTDTESFSKAARTAGVRTADDDTWEQIFNRVWLTAVEPTLPKDGAVVAYEYPRQVPTFAHPIDGTPYCNRWELFARGLEVANCFQEETNPTQLLQMIDQEAIRKKHTATTWHPPDRQMAEAIQDGPMICSGVAVGVERLIMALDGLNKISDVLPFPLHESVPL